MKYSAIFCSTKFLSSLCQSSFVLLLHLALNYWNRCKVKDLLFQIIKIKGILIDFLKEDLGAHEMISTRGLPTTYYRAAYNQESKLERKWASLNKTLSFLKELVNISNVFIKDTVPHARGFNFPSLFLKP